MKLETTFISSKLQKLSKLGTERLSSTPNSILSKFSVQDLSRIKNIKKREEKSAGRITIFHL